MPSQQHQTAQDTDAVATQGDQSSAQSGGGRGNASRQDLLRDRTSRAQAMNTLATWVAAQRLAIAELSGAEKVARIEGVLSTLESTWVRVSSGEAVDLDALPSAPVATASTEAAGVALPPELISTVRPLIATLEAGVSGADTTGHAPESSPHSGTDWNSRLGVPEYRTQSDNFAGPEATCNTTTMAMALERLGVGRDDVLAAVEKRIKLRWIDQQRRAGALTRARADQLKGDLSLVDQEEGWDRDAEWQSASRRYIDGVMKDRPYQRVRGQASLSAKERDELSGGFRDRAQMEDLIDMLVSQIPGQSRYGIVSEPDTILSEVSTTGLPPQAEKLWGGTPWKTVRDRIRQTLEAGGAAAYSFRHKGTRKGTHIVSVQDVRDDALVVDDPYGEVRASYNPKAYDDAYYHADTYQQRDRSGRMVTKERVIHERSKQKNTQHGFDDWGVGAARSLDADESKGDTTEISKRQVERGMLYVTLFSRGARVPRPVPRPADLDTSTGG